MSLAETHFEGRGPIVLPEHVSQVDGITFKVYRDVQTTAEAAAQGILDVMTSCYEPRITFATGATMEPVLEAIVQSGIKGSHIRANHLDEYVGAGPQDWEGFVRFLNDRILDPIGVVHRDMIKGLAKDSHAEAARYDEIVSSQPADLVILGIGPGGHIGFNEVGTPFDRRTHVEELSPETVARDLSRLQPLHTHAITQGPATIIEGPEKKFVVVAYGPEKGQWIRDCMENAIDPQYPASILRLPDVAPKTTFYIDLPAAQAMGLV